MIDTGIGISPAALEWIFQPFEQAGSAEQRAEGTGLGLAISQRLIRQMGGSIHVQSQLGQGSTFWFELSVPVVAAQAATTYSGARAVIGYTGPRRSILVADDSPYNRTFLVKLLTTLGFMVLEAFDGSSALALALSAQPDLILMDLLMPGMTGMEVTQAVRQQAELHKVVIVATSASVFDSDRQQSLLAGCDAFLPKPIRVEQLLELLATHLDLEWCYADSEPGSAVPAAAEAIEEGGALAAPGREELAALFELASIGDILGLQARAAELEQHDPRLGPFARRLGSLAGRFEPEQARALIARFLRTEE